MKNLLTPIALILFFLTLTAEGGPQRRRKRSQEETDAASQAREVKPKNEGDWRDVPKQNFPNRAPVVNAPAVPRAANLPLAQSFIPANLKPSASEVTALVNKALEAHANRPLVAGENTPWEIVHGILAWQRELQIVSNGSPISAVEYLRSYAVHDKLPAFEVTPDGIRGRAYQPKGGVWHGGFEGHPDQFLGYLSELNLNPKTQWGALNGTRWELRSLQDLVNDAKAQLGINPTDRQPYELTWALWGLSQYVSPGEQWTSRNGQRWNLPRMMEYEVRAGIQRDTSCAGTHRAYVIARALQLWDMQGFKPQFEQALSAVRNGRNFVARYRKLAEEFQNTDGSLSGDSFFSPTLATDQKSRLTSNGHMLEFVVGSSTDEELRDTWVERAVCSVALDLATFGKELKGNHGPKYHAIHALQLFKQRRPDLFPAPPPMQIQ